MRDDTDCLLSRLQMRLLHKITGDIIILKDKIVSLT
jgi:hypothetical protein